MDENHIDLFLKHIAPLKRNQSIENWYDRKILAGKDYQDEIDNNLEDADIICLFISANFLASNACMEERDVAIELVEKKGITVIPIILSPCGWSDDHELRRLLALPTDGKPITKFDDDNIAWNDVYKSLRDVINNLFKIKELKINDGFREFLNNADLLSKAHSQKDQVLLEDIFVHTELSKFDYLREYEKKITSHELIEQFYGYSKILIAGESQSGKTTLCKQIFVSLREMNFVPIYIFDRTFQFQGKMENRIAAAFKDQYTDINLDEIDPKRIVPIIDDFFMAKNRERHIRDLSIYKFQVIVVDDIFNLNLKDETLIKQYIHFRIEELTPLLQNELIKKWAYLSDEKNGNHSQDNSLYKQIDEKTELVNTTLGKIFGKGIMPAYPFFILSIISTYETFAKPLDQEITSQGYCYQAFIYMYLRKQGVKNEDIDTYINFLTELSFFFYLKHKNEISIDEFSQFIESYLEEFNLPVEQKILIERLQKSHIIAIDSFNNCYFCYKYLYYFFVAKYLAEHVGENRHIIDDLIKNLHKNENAYISIFISHHSKETVILDEIVLNALCLFDNYEPATLSDKELNFFDDQVDEIVNAVLPPPNVTPEMVREERLNGPKEHIEDKIQADAVGVFEEDQELVSNLRRSIKTVEVMGCIIKNRAGSLNRARLESMFEEAMDVHLRILSSFFKLIKTEEEQQEIINYISENLKLFIEDTLEKKRKEGKKEREPTHEELEKLSKNIFWNINFMTIFGLVNKIITSIGSNKLLQIADSVCNRRDTPAAFLIKHGIFMWYNKNLQLDEITKKIDQDGFSRIAKKIMNYLIVDHCSMHSISYKDKQRIEQKFGVSSKKLLECVLRE